MHESQDVVFKVWGARGAIFCGGPDKVVFGGDTTCFSLSHAGGMTIVDAGSGLRTMGEALAKGLIPPVASIDLLLTHLHFDHICGLPFFEPIFSDDIVLRIWNADFQHADDFRETLARIMSPPTFPKFRDWDAVRFCPAEVGAGIPLAMGGTATPFPLRHPDRAFGWRIDCNGKSATIAADHEAGCDAIDAGIISAAQQTDILVCDAMYTEAEIATRSGWGHSTWQQGLAMGEAAGARHILMSHHDPARSDTALEAMEREARATNAAVTFARSGWSHIL